MNNNYDKIIKYSNDIAPNEKNNVDQDLINLPRLWTFWEGYEAEDNTIDWTNSFKKLFSLKDIITFWQFWNNTHYSNFSEIFFNGTTFKLFYKNKKRINSINFFVEGISPKWEDENNRGGHILSSTYEIKENEKIPEYLKFFQKLWMNLVLMVLGESLEASNYINGIRFKDKAIPNKKILFIFEVWIHKEIDTEITNTLEKLTLKLKNHFENTIEEKKIK